MQCCHSPLHCRHVTCPDDPQPADDGTWQNQRQSLGRQGSNVGVGMQGCVGEFRGGQGPGEQAAADDGRWQPARILEQARPLQAQEVCSQTLLLYARTVCFVINKEFLTHSPADFSNAVQRCHCVQHAARTQKSQLHLLFRFFMKGHTTSYLLVLTLTLKSFGFLMMLC